MQLVARRNKTNRPLIGNYNAGVYSASGVYGASTGAVAGCEEFTACLMFPFNAKPVSLPDTKMTPHMLKSVNYNENYEPTVAAGMMVLPTSSSRNDIRVYLFDTVTQSMNYLFSIQPDLVLASTYIRGRPISTGLQVYSNTVSSGVFTIQGAINAITYISLPPLNIITPMDRDWETVFE